MKVLTRKARFALSGILSPGVIGFGAHLVGLGRDTLGGTIIAYGCCWAVAALISFFTAADGHDLFTDEYSSSLQSAIAANSALTYQLKEERELREKFQLALESEAGK